MTQTVQALDISQQRREAVAETVASVRALEGEMGVTRETLERIKAEIQKLSTHKALFPVEDFPLRDGKGLVYCLSEDEDKRFALYMSCGVPGKKVPPHNHTTWAVIVGVQGEEENYFYERSDGGSGPGKASLRQIGSDVVRDGTGVTLMPEDIHHIQVREGRQTMHFHMYGLSLEHLPQRVVYDVEAGNCRIFPAMPNIVDMQ